jgi:LacI family transcriptional regulator
LASTLASKKTHIFAVLLPEVSYPDAYWSKPLKGVNDAAAELMQYGIIVETHYFSQSNPASFQEKANLILKQKPEGVVFAPFFSRESQDFIDKLDRMEIPYVFIDSNIGTSNKLSFIGQNSFQSGMLAAKLFDYALPDNSKILIIHFGKELDNQNHPKQRGKGFCNYFKEAGKEVRKKTYTIETEPRTDEEFFDLIDREIEKLGGVNGIFVTNSQVFRIAEYLESRNIQHIRLIGHDLIRQNAAFLKTGVVDFLICQRPEEQGHQAIQTLFDHILLKKEIRKDNYTSIDIVTKENLDYYKEFNQR